MAIPGSFDWDQPETGWTYKSDSFSTTRDAILVHRQANPRFNLSLNPERIEWEMEARYEAKLRSMPGGTQWLLEVDTNAPAPSFLNPRTRSVAAVGARLENARAGIGAITEWLGNGLRPVLQAEATSRAEVCSVCPKNQEGDFWQRMEGEAGKAIKMLVQAKNDMRLVTPYDSKLKSCMACDCRLETKVWQPLDQILSHTQPETMAKLDPACWILKK